MIWLLGSFAYGFVGGAAGQWFRTVNKRVFPTGAERVGGEVLALMLVVAWPFLLLPAYLSTRGLRPD